MINAKVVMFIYFLNFHFVTYFYLICYLFILSRGEDRDAGTKANSKNNGPFESEIDSALMKASAENKITYVTDQTDIQICYSTLSGYVSVRNATTGVYYVSYFCKVFAERAHNTDLHHLLKDLSERFGCSSMIHHVHTTENVDRGFRKTLYFNPGYYGDLSTASEDRVSVADVSNCVVIPVVEVPQPIGNTSELTLTETTVTESSFPCSCHIFVILWQRLKDFVVSSFASFCA